MKFSVRHVPRFVLGVALLGLVLTGCGRNCTSCSTAGSVGLATAEVNMRFCMSSVPNPSDENRSCDELDVTVVEAAR